MMHFTPVRQCLRGRRGRQDLPQYDSLYLPRYHLPELQGRRGRPDLTDFFSVSSCLPPARNACPLKSGYGRWASQREAGGSRDVQACPPVPGDGRRARQAGLKPRNLNPPPAERGSALPNLSQSRVISGHSQMSIITLV